MDASFLQDLSTHLKSMSQFQSHLQANALNNNYPFPMPNQQLPLNRGHGCNNPFRTATAASPFAATGASVFRLGG